MQLAVCLSTKPAPQRATAAANPQEAARIQLLSEITYLRIVAVLSGPTQEPLGFSTVANIVTVEKGNREMVLSLFLPVLRRVVRPDGLPVRPYSCRPIAICPYPVLKAVAVAWTGRAPPPLKGTAEVSQFPVCRGYVA